jgi:hypothetical protein
MEARALVDGAPFGSRNGESYWPRRSIRHGHAYVPQEIETARLRLAEAMLAVATEGSRDIAALKDRVIEAMASAGARGCRGIVAAALHSRLGPSRIPSTSVGHGVRSHQGTFLPPQISL